MAKYNVMINLTRTIEYSVEIEVTAKDEDAAEAKATEKVEKYQERITEKGGDIVKLLDLEQTSEDDSFEYSVSEA